jgi:dynactin complex subunit
MQGGKRYFSCPEKHGIFVAVSDIALVKDRHRLNYRSRMNNQMLSMIDNFSYTCEQSCQCSGFEQDQKAW